MNSIYYNLNLEYIVVHEMFHNITQKLKKKEKYNLEGKDFKSNINPNSLEVLTGCKVEPSLTSAKPLDRFQFERMGYFCVDPDTANGKLVLNRTVTLRDTWARIQKKQSAERK